MAKFELKVLGYWLAEGQENLTLSVLRFAEFYRRTCNNDPPAEEYIQKVEPYLVCSTCGFYDMDNRLPRAPFYELDPSSAGRPIPAEFTTWSYKYRKDANSAFMTLMLTPKTTCWLIKRKLIKA